MSKIVEVPRRRGIWLHTYEYVRSRTTFQWFAYSLLGGLALFGGLAFGWLALTAGSDVPLAGRLLRLAIPIAMIGYGLLEFPAGIIYLVRRRRDEPVDLWDCETPEDPAVQERRHPHH